MNSMWYKASYLKLGLFLLTIVGACRWGTDHGQSSEPEVLLLDSIHSSMAILEDTTELFFDQINSLDMAIQMKMPLPEGVSKTDLLASYQAYLQTDVGSFSLEENQFIEPILEQAIQDCEALWPGLLPQQIELIKTHGQHYGPGVFYTRENRIIIPENELEKKDEPQMYWVMVHELFHLISRHNPTLRNELYALIGFKPLPLRQHYTIPDTAFEARILLNPDGVVRHYAITLKLEEGDTISAIPLLESVSETYQPYLPNYFNYMKFGLYPLQNRGGEWQLQATPLSEAQLSDFYRQIGDNTEYIIHPDEIIAENFTLLVLQSIGKLNTKAERLSSEGELLLDRLSESLNQYAKTASQESSK